MALRSSQFGFLAVCAASASITAVGCHPSRDESAHARPTQGAVGAAVEHLSRVMSNTLEPRGADDTSSSASLLAPAVQVHGEGVGARVELHEDAAHASPVGLRTAEGWALAWVDGAHTRTFFARVDEQGRPLAAPVVEHEARTDEEEDVQGESMAFNGRGFAMSWVDPANQRVAFQRLDLEGHIVGRPTIVHEGLEMPLGSRVAWNGREYGIAVAMNEGVYFARVSPEGARVGAGTIVAEGTPVAGLDALTAGPDGFQLAWHDAGEGQTRHEVRVGADGRVAGVNPSAPSTSIRIASR